MLSSPTTPITKESEMTELYRKERTARVNRVVTGTVGNKPCFTARIEYIDGFVISKSFYDVSLALDFLRLNG